MTTTVQLDRWNTIVKEIKFDNKWNETLKNYLKEQKLDELPTPEWTENDPTMAYIYLPTRDLKGNLVRMDKTKVRMFPESIVGYLEKGGLMELPKKVEAPQRSQKKEQLPKMETEKPTLDKKLENKIGDLKDE
jgi:DNA-directed RNA polymerase subunit H (RpoH/RPB5)|tara:strand:+ start:26195 stop:26593 length:399 start_codon:yes stop_codon:yes gene_type:complete